MRTLPKIYKRTQTGAVQTWEIIASGNTFWTIEGQLNGKLTTSMPTIVEGKNVGRSNATSDEEQAFKEAESRWKKKVERGYFLDINNIDNKGAFFEPMLAHKYVDNKDNIEFPVLVSPKIDGCRMVADKNGLWTRNGKQYVSCPHIVRILAPLFERHPNWIIDGEVYSYGGSFEKIISLVKKTKPTKEDLTESEKLVEYWIFDGVVDDTSTCFKDRFKLIKDEITRIIELNDKLVFVDVIEVNSHEEIEAKHDEFVGKGFEGAMIRVPDSEYQNKRSKSLLKFKKFLDAEFVISDVEEGVGNRAGMAGKLILIMKNGSTFGAGIKGNEGYYKQLLRDKSKLIGKLATVRYQELTADGVPRFPVVVDVGRFDVDE
jgi:ATP-dependent DNA ligase